MGSPLALPQPPFPSFVRCLLFFVGKTFLTTRALFGGSSIWRDAQILSLPSTTVLSLFDREVLSIERQIFIKILQVRKRPRYFENLNLRWNILHLLILPTQINCKEKWPLFKMLSRNRRNIYSDAGVPTAPVRNRRDVQLDTEETDQSVCRKIPFRLTLPLPLVVISRYNLFSYSALSIPIVSTEEYVP